MLRYSSQLVEFKLSYEVYEQAKKTAKKKGHNSPGLYAKALLSSALEGDSNDNIRNDIIEEIHDLRGEVEKLWEALEKEKREQEQFRKTVGQTLAAILEQLQKPIPANIKQQPLPIPQQSSNQNKSESQPKTEQFIDRYAHRRR